MKIGPFTAFEHRASYTDLVLAVAQANATGASTAYPASIGALEAASGLVSRAFASAVVESESTLVIAALTPECLALVGRALIRKGQILFLIDTTGGVLNVIPAEAHDIDGGPLPSSWRYRLTVGGPSSTMTYSDVPSESVLHFKYAAEPGRPYRGIGPLEAAQLTSRLAAETAATLADESAGPRGSFLGVPVNGTDPTVAKMRTDIKKLGGQLALLETGDWGEAAGGGQFVLKPERVGAEPPAALVELFKITREDVLGACGINPALLMDAQGTAMREAYRQFLFGTVSPLGRMVAAELSAKLDTPIKLDWEELRASDIAGRARAFGTMVTGGMDLDKAAALSGLLTAE